MAYRMFRLCGLHPFVPYKYSEIGTLPVDGQVFSVVPFSESDDFKLAGIELMQKCDGHTDAARKFDTSFWIKNLQPVEKLFDENFGVHNDEVGEKRLDY